ncbi:hypothetical protein LJ114_02610 [Propionibacterium freudenreichii]|uniref:hypothetical protein n=1 Tax=Propionibacterium freudenreichii TaxID=1744 RepID=UPI0005CBE8C3|nr:hypothetical protein [Propionibacterium freudenreichii]MDK9341227.1 hypothetical protein [Propionibacterium freudenreichii]MDK9670351.1 hypothetical protein [Propionibacterium freudenreichii]WBF62345.1 hypothetical protein LJ114_02610 [Propionibacterium freudenreichii]
MPAVSSRPEDSDPNYTLNREEPDIARYIDYGSSPRGSLAFLEAAKAGALLAGRDHVLPEDIKAMRHPVLRHRIVLTFEAIAEQVHPETIIDAVFDAVPTP